MARPPLTLSRRPFMALALLLLVAFAGPARDTILFVADFNPVSADPSASEFLAKGGEFVVVGPPDVFHVELESVGEGVLTVGDNPFSSPGVLTGKLSEPAAGLQLDVSLDMSVSGGLTDLGVSIIDDDGGEMIDITFDDQDDGLISVGGQVVAFDPSGADPGAGGFHVAVQFKQHMFGMRSWTVTLTGAFGSLKFQGFVPGLGDLTIAKLRIVRPGSTRGGGWQLDDIVVSKPLDGSLTNDS